MTTEEKELILAYRGMTDEEKKAFLIIAAKLAEKM